MAIIAEYSPSGLDVNWRGSKRQISEFNLQTGDKGIYRHCEIRQLNSWDNADELSKAEHSDPRHNPVWFPATA